jgi:arylsulfatase
LSRNLCALGVATVLLSAGCGREPQSSTASEPEASQPAKPPNVLIVLVDTLRRDHLSTYGYPLPTSPNLDELAAESVTFTNAFSHSTWTKPSIATLFTSLYPPQHGLARVAFENNDGVQTHALNKRLPTLAKRFRKAGYATAAFSANLHVKRKTGFARGFEHFVFRRTKSAFDLNQLLRSWHDEIDERPFFAYLHYMDTHWPYNRKLAQTRSRFGNTRIKPNPPVDWTLVGRWAEDFLSDETLRALKARYDEEIAFVDEALGQLLRWLRETGAFADTIIVFTSDHGEGFNEHGELQHGFRPYEELAQIPLIIRLPAWLEGEPRTVDDLVGLVDVAPTLLDLSGLRPLPAAAGRSLAPLMRGEAMPQGALYLEGSDAQGLRTPTNKLLVTAGGDAHCLDLAEDPQELAPISGPLPAECRSLVEDLEQLRRRLAAEFDPLERPAETVPLSEEELKALRTLGYLDG